MLNRLRYATLIALLLNNPNSAYSQETQQIKEEAPLELLIKKMLKAPDSELEDAINNIDPSFIESLNVKGKYDDIIRLYDSISENLQKYELKELTEDKKLKLSRVFNEFGFAYGGKGLWAYAVKNFSIAYKLDDKNLSSLINLSRAYLEIKDNNNAILYAQKYLEKDDQQRHLALRIIENAKSKAQ